MSMETSLIALLKAICPTVWEIVAPSGVVAPYVVWQGFGGQSLRNLDKTASDKRNTLMQISVWSSTRTEAKTMIRAIEDAMCASTALSVSVEGEPLYDYEDDTKLFGAIQRFSIIAAR